jgi:hypothetical protein
VLEFIFGGMILDSIFNGSDNSHRPTKKDLVMMEASKKRSDECWEYACEQQRRRLNAKHV